MKVCRTLTFALLALVVTSVAFSQEPFTAGTWRKTTHAPQSPVGHMLLLTDGSVLVNSFFFSVHPDPWYRLIPDSKGSYLNGTWTGAGTLPAGYNPLYFASAVVPSGNVFIMGGEYNNATAVWSTLGAQYHVKTNSWSAVSAPPNWARIGDAQSVVLPSGKFMLANCCTTDEAILTNTSPITWTSTGTGKFDENDEEGWTLLPSGNVLAVDAYVNAYNSTGTHSERYNTSTGTWSSAGSTIKQLWDSAAACGGSSKASYELGPAVLRPDGTVFYAGANQCAAGHTAIYHSATGTWTAGQDFPAALDVADGPAALLPDGNVLLDTSPGFDSLGVQFYEWDGAAFNAVPSLPDAAKTTSYYGNMLCLPSGQVMFTDFSANVYIYTPSGAYKPAWQPTITSVGSSLTHGSANNVVKGKQLNGLSQCSVYGDDSQAATNFPLVRITNNSTKHVFYARTHTFSTMGVATGSAIVSALFDVPSTIELGASTLVVVANGIPSAPVNVDIL